MRVINDLDVCMYVASDGLSSLGLAFPTLQPLRENSCYFLVASIVKATGVKISKSLEKSFLNSSLRKKYYQVTIWVDKVAKNYNNKGAVLQYFMG